MDTQDQHLPAVATYILLIFVGLSLSRGLSARPIPCLFNQLTVQSGLTSQNYNYFVYKSRDHYVWISSMDGLNRFDGRTIRTFTAQPLSADSLQNNSTSTPFLEDYDGAIWVNGLNRFYRYDPDFGCFQHHRVPGLSEGDDNRHHLKYLDIQRRHVWVQVDDALYLYPLYDRQAAKRVYRSPLLRTNSLVYTRQGADGQYLLLNYTPTGLSVHAFLSDPDSLVIAGPSRQYFSGQAVNSAYYVDDRNLWIGLVDGLAKVDLTAEQPVLLATHYQKNRVSGVVAIQQMDEDHLLVATADLGIFIYQISTDRYVGRLYKQLPDRTEAFLHEVHTIYLDEDRTLWITSPSQGVYYTHLDKIKFDNYFLANYPDAVRTGGIKSMTEDRQGRIWAIAEQKIFVWDSLGRPISDLYRDVNRNPNLQGAFLYFIKADKQGKLWLGGSRGAFLYNPELRSFFPIWLDKSSPNPVLMTWVHQLKDGRIIAPSTWKGVYELRGNEDNEIQGRQWIQDENTYNWLYEYEDGRLLLAQYQKGLHIMRGLTYPPQQDTFLELPHRMGGIVEDQRRQRLWIPTGSGLFYLPLNERLPVIHKDTFTGNLPVRGLLVDSSGNLWLSTSNQGLLLYCPESGKRKRYYLHEGIQGQEFHVSSFYESKDGKLFFGGVNGVNIIGNDTIRSIDAAAYPVISELQIDGLTQDQIRDANTSATETDRIRNLRLPYRHNSLFFSFASREYSHPEAVNYRFLLIRNRDTITIGNEATARFLDLREGNYQLQVMATNSDGQWSPDPYVMQFSIAPPFQRTWLGYSLQILLLLSVGFAIALWRIRVIRRKAAERIERLETENAVFRLQMNPHFLSNSVNAIAGYVIKQDIGKAYDYLSRFGQMMRQMLYLAAKPLITLKEEVDLLNQYLYLEQMRFQGKISYDIKVDDGLEPETIQVPTMLVQPFIENAIKHGLRSKGGHVQVDFYPQDEYLQCRVSDNGIGRKAAAQNKKASGHISRALDITERRLRILREQTQQESSLQIVDLYDDEGGARGTQVILTIPIL